jgi:hypothetical protein
VLQRRVSIGSARSVTTGAVAGLMILALPAISQSPNFGDPPEAKNMRLVGYSDLHARSAYLSFPKIPFDLGVASSG